MITIILTLLVIKHFIADFLLQFNYMIEEKGTYLATGGIQHSAIHGILTYFILLYATNPLMACQLALLDFAIHYHIDWAKTNLSQGLTTSDQKYWAWFGLDQLLHYLTYILIIGLIL